VIEIKETISIITKLYFFLMKRNSAVSLCQTFARMGAVIAPNVQLLVIKKFHNISDFLIFYFG
jgi:hypothetical protein